MKQEVRNPFERGPFVQIAAFCERVLHEADGVLSLIRIVDVVTHVEKRPDAPDEMPEVRYPLTLVIMLKSGTARGRHEVIVTPQQPSGEKLAPLSMSVIMEGENKAANLLSRVDIPFKQEGLYWFNVYFDKDLITSVPLELRYTRMVTGQASQKS